MTIKTTKNCIEKLIVEGGNASEIVAMTPSNVLTPVPLSSDYVDRPCEVAENDLINSSLKTMFEPYLQDIGCTEAEAQTVVLGLEKERLLTGQSAYTLQVIKSVNFDWDKCPIKVLEDHRHEKNFG